jgi:hypothetical protein
MFSIRLRLLCRGQQHAQFQCGEGEDVGLGVMFALCLPRIRCGAGHRRNAWLKEQGLLSVKDLWCKAQGYSAEPVWNFVCEA